MFQLLNLILVLKKQLVVDFRRRPACRSKRYYGCLVDQAYGMITKQRGLGGKTPSDTDRLKEMGGTKTCRTISNLKKDFQVLTEESIN